MTATVAPTEELSVQKASRAKVTDGQPLSCFKYPSATNRSLLILFILFSDETNSRQTLRATQERFLTAV